MIIFGLSDYDITHDELIEWAKETGSDVYAIASHGASDPRTRYAMDEKDMVIFKLAIARMQDRGIVVGYKGRSTPDTASYYCPYIPLLKNDDNT